MPETLTLEGLFRKFYETIGPERIIFGTDSEWFPRGFAVRYLLDQLRACRSLNMPESHIRCIFRENALGLL
jgi:predicted TIM-barrel fold metal-dependent hydrolase